MKQKIGTIFNKYLHDIKKKGEEATTRQFIDKL